MDILDTPSAGEPSRWIVVFNRKGLGISRFIPGRYKHVRAFGFVPAVGTWVFVDFAIARTQIVLVRDEAAKRIMDEWSTDADMIGIPVRTSGRRFFPAAFFCTTAIRHLVGLRGGALLPDTLFRDLLANGGELIGHASGPAAVRPAPA